jgi:3-methylcrotonyl-CoA carboxylase beta subunit
MITFVHTKWDYSYLAEKNRNMSDEQKLMLERNADELKLLISKMKRRGDEIRLGGGKAKLQQQKDQGKLTARERVSYLIDQGREFMELGLFTAFGHYEEHGGCPAGGVIIGLGYISERLCMIVANDATVKAGAWFPLTGKKNLRAQEIATENRLPVIYLVDSAGIFLPMQDEIFADKEHFGRIFRNNAKMSSMGIPQVSAIMGSCVAGGAYLPIMSDEAIIVDKTGSIFLAGPYLVKAAIGEEVDQETLGGAHTQSNISGVTDYIAKDDKDALDMVREIVKSMGSFPKAGLDRIESKPPKFPVDTLLRKMPVDPTKPYNTKELLECLVDEDSLLFYKADYGKTIFTAYARVDGWSVGIVANNREISKNAKGELQFGGVIYSDSADKATRFIMNCNQKKIPLIFLHDVTGFMVGKRAEHGGIIKDGAKMVNAVSNSTVPKITVIMGNSYGAGNYAMCGKAYDPRFIYAWPTAKIAVMGGTQAAKVLTQIQVSALQKQGKEVDETSQKELFNKIQAKYESHTSPYYAASNLWVDEIIDPRETRKFISISLEAANHGEIERFNVGVIQT